MFRMFGLSIQNRIGGEKVIGNIMMVSILVIETILVFKWKVATHALAYYLELKQYTQPSKKEMEACTAYVVKKMLKIRDQDAD